MGRRVRVYIAASYPRRNEARVLAEDLRAEGMDITSRWLYAEEGYGLGINHGEAAQRDEHDVRIADIIVQLTGDILTKGGRHTELGMAIVLKKPVLLVGPKEQVFHDHPAVVGVIEQFDKMTAEIAPLVAAAIVSCTKIHGVVGMNVIPPLGEMGPHHHPMCRCAIPHLQV